MSLSGPPTGCSSTGGICRGAALVPYLHDLGVETLYLSPSWPPPRAARTATTWSTRPARPGTRSAGDSRPCSTSSRPRHAGPARHRPEPHGRDPSNRWWWDTLRRGQSSKRRPSISTGASTIGVLTRAGATAGRDLAEAGAPGPDADISSSMANVSRSLRTATGVPRSPISSLAKISDRPLEAGRHRRELSAILQHRRARRRQGGGPGGVRRGPTNCARALRG